MAYPSHYVQPCHYPNDSRLYNIEEAQKSCQNIIYSGFTLCDYKSWYLREHDIVTSLN